MKKIFLCIFVITLCGCSIKIKTNHNDEIKTIIEENKNSVISINYPKTNIPILDNKIEKYINTNYKNFKNDYNNLLSLSDKSELNIDYEYYYDDNYLSIGLFTFINSTNLENSLFNVKTFLYDLNKNKILSFSDIVEDEELNDINATIINKLIQNNIELDCIKKQKDYDNFIINDEFVFVFVENNKIDIPINLFSKLNIEASSDEQTVFQTQENTKVLDPTKKTVAITFDDGPSKYTKEIINIFKKYDSNATFFVLGNKVEIYKDTLIESLKNGNEIGNHSYNHKWLIKLSLDEFKEQVNKTQQIIKDNTGYTPTLIRPTYGSINQKMKNSIDLDVVLWNVDSTDWKLKNAKKITNKVLKNVKDGSIILFHDTYKWTADALKTIIPKLIEDGYQLVTVSELKEIELLRENLNYEQS